MRAQLETFLLEHQRILASIERAEATEAKLEPLVKARDEVLSHFRAKDAFYPALAEHLTLAGDAAGAQLARIFEQNMKIQSAAVQRFFDGLERAPVGSLPDSLKTVAAVIRQRFTTEEKAVFPLTSKKEPRVKK